MRFLRFAILLCVTTTLTVADQDAVTCQFGQQVIPLPEMPEASGVAIRSGSPARLWIINDSGPPLLFSVALNGQVTDRVRVTGAAVENWEDLASGACGTGRCLYIADIGDNRGVRKEITVYRVPEPAAGATATAPAEVFHGRYPDGPQDAESIFVDRRGVVFIVTKSRETKLYRFPMTARDQLTTLASIGAIAGPARATGAATSPDGAWTAIRSNNAIAFARTAGLIAGNPGTPQLVDLGPLKEPQGEGVAIGANGTVFLVSEAGNGRIGTMRTMTCTLPR